MRSRALSSYNVINLIKNGGLAMSALIGEAPPFWAVTGAKYGASPTSNRFNTVTGHTPESANGASRYIEFGLSSDDEVFLTYEFYEKFQTESAGRSVPPAVVDCPSPVHYLEDEWKRYYEVGETQIVRGNPITFSFSAKVTAGSVEVVTRFSIDPDEVGYVDYTQYASLASEDWVRPAQTHNLGNYRLNKVQIKMKRTRPGTSRIQLGNFMLGAGGHSVLPFTGDMLADTFAKGTIIFAVGEYCPAGFEKMSFTSPEKMGRIFVKSAAGSELEEGGEETHTHEDAMTMNPVLDWDTFDLQPPAPASSVTDPVPSADGRVPHTHPLGTAYHIPPSKDVILCRRL